MIAGTAGEAVHTLDGLLGHDSSVDIGALHVDGGGVSDIIFAVMHLLGISFEPRIPRLSDRRLYAFEPRARYGRLTQLFGQRLDAGLIRAHWDEIVPIIAAMRNRTVTPSLILKSSRPIANRMVSPPPCERSAAWNAHCLRCDSSTIRSCGAW